MSTMGCTYAIFPLHAHRYNHDLRLVLVRDMCDQSPHEFYPFLVALNPRKLAEVLVDCTIFIHEFDAGFGASWLCHPPLLAFSPSF
ncbi:MAG: hypothetical protein KME50_36710 [Nostoc desertorum CM1-VF14]|nr:hypothetical protein [Nostoc desertorum CM1-VF14]